MHSFFINFLCFFLKNQVFIGVWIDIWVFDLVLLVLLSVLMPIPGCFQYCRSVVEFEIRCCDASRCSFIVQDCFGYLGFLFLLMKLSIVLSRSVNFFTGILMGIALNR